MNYIKRLIKNIKAKDWFEVTYALSSKWNSFTYYIYRKEMYRLRLFARFRKTPYYGAWEMCEEILHYPFEMLLEFYENEGKNIYEGEGQVPDVLAAKEEMKWLCNWYNVTRLERQEEVDCLLHVWCEHYVSWIGNCNSEGYSVYNSAPNTKYTNFLSKMHAEEEQKFEQEKEDALIRLIKIRGYMWH